MHNYTIATVLYKSFVWEERGGDREQFKGERLKERKGERKRGRKEDREEGWKEEKKERGGMEKLEELGRGEINSNLHVLAYSKHTYRDWVVDDRVLQEPHH